MYNDSIMKKYYVGSFKKGFEKNNGWFVGDFLPEGFAIHAPCVPLDKELVG